MFSKHKQYNIARVIFPVKVLCYPWAITAQKFPNVVFPKTDPDYIVDHFPWQSCLWTVGQHCTSNCLAKSTHSNESL